METFAYRRWSPSKSRLHVEFPSELLFGLAEAEPSGILYGARSGNDIRILSLNAPQGGELTKVGVFVARIRGEVFLTETDLAYFKEHENPDVQVALVVAGDRAGFFVREPDGSIQTVRSHEEFSIAPEAAPPVAAVLRGERRAPRLLGEPMWKLARGWKGVGLALLAALPLAALAMIPQSVDKTPLALEVHEMDGQLRISWEPGRNAVLGIKDGDCRLATPVSTNQSSLTYLPRGPQVEVSLVTVDAANHPRRASAFFISSKPDRSSLPAHSSPLVPVKRGRP